MGRVDTRNREGWITTAALGACAAAFLLAVTSSSLPLAALWITVAGIAIGAIDVATYSLRQRVTHSNWLGRANAVSMMLISAGTPMGAAIAGLVVASSIHAGLLLAPTFTAISVVIASLTLRRRHAIDMDSV
jgi:MFS family permease